MPKGWPHLVGCARIDQHQFVAGVYEISVHWASEGLTLNERRLTQLRRSFFLITDNQFWTELQVTVEERRHFEITDLAPQRTCHRRPGQRRCCMCCCRDQAQSTCRAKCSTAGHGAAQEAAPVHGNCFNGHTCSPIPFCQSAPPKEAVPFN
jgi:hypothetical protein